MKFFLIFLLISFSFSIFGSPQNNKENTISKEDKVKVVAPEWIKFKKELVKVEGKYYFHAVGISKDLGDDEMTQAASADNGKVTLSFLLKDYVYSMTGQRMELDMPKKDYFNLPKNKSKVIKSWVDSKDKTVYTLVELNVSSVKLKPSTSFIDKMDWKFKRVAPVVFPEWTKKANSIIKRDGKYYFHIVGSSSDLGDEGMTISASADDARVNLSFFLKATVKSTVSKSSNGDETVVTQTMTKMRFSGTKVIKRWVNSNNNTVYSLLEASVDMINKYNNNLVTPEMIENVKKKSEESYKKMEKKLDNLGGF